MIARFGRFTFDSERRLVVDERDQPCHLTAKAFELLQVLIVAAPRVVTKRELHERIWPDSYVVDATLVGLVKELRRVLNDGDPEQTLIRTSHGVGYALNLELQPVAVAATQQHWLVVAERRRIGLTAGENIIGRDPRCAVWLEARGVSRQHARIVVAGAQAQLEDLGSKNGTSLGGTPLTGPMTLRDGDTIVLGSLSLQYRVSETGLPTDTIPTA